MVAANAKGGESDLFIQIPSELQELIATASSGAAATAGDNKGQPHSVTRAAPSPDQNDASDSAAIAGTTTSSSSVASSSSVTSVADTRESLSPAEGQRYQKSRRKQEGRLFGCFHFFCFTLPNHKYVHKGLYFVGVLFTNVYLSAHAHFFRG